MAVKEVVTDEAGAVRIRGYASTPDLDRYRDIVEPTAFKDALGMYLKNPVLLRSHNPDKPVGLVDVATITEKGLWVEGIIKDKEMADEINAGLFRTLSIGYMANRTELQHEDGTAFDPAKDDPWDNSLVRVIKELDLVEISIVATPANGNALFTLAKSLKSLTRQLALKSFGLEAKDEGNHDEGDPEGEKEPETPTTEESSETETPAEAEGEKATEEKPECTTDDGKPGHMVDGECVAKKEDEKQSEPEKKEEPEAPSEPAGEAIQSDEQPEGKTEGEQTEEAEKAGETPAAESGEGVTAEEPVTEATPASEPEAAPEGDQSEKAIVLTKDLADKLPALKTVGAIREQEGGEKTAELTKATMILLVKLHDALVNENKRANELQETLDNTPEKKVLSPHKQFAAEEPAKDETKEAERRPKSQTSQFFMNLFTPKS